MMFKSIMKTDIDLRKELFANICLSGGTTLISGFPQRIFNEINSKKQDKISKVIS